MAFWGIAVQPNVPCELKLTRRLVIKQAAMHITKPHNKHTTAVLSVAVATDTNKKYVVCRLAENQLEQCPMELPFCPDDGAVFHLTGSHAVHLTGFLELDDEDEYDEIGEMDDEVERAIAPPSSKKPKAAAAKPKPSPTMPDDDDDGSDDSQGSGSLEEDDDDDSLDDGLDDEDDEMDEIGESHTLHGTPPCRHGAEEIGNLLAVFDHGPGGRGHDNTLSKPDLSRIDRRPFPLGRVADPRLTPSSSHTDDDEDDDDEIDVDEGDNSEDDLDDESDDLGESGEDESDEDESDEEVAPPSKGKRQAPSPAAAPAKKAKATPVKETKPPPTAATPTSPASWSAEEDRKLNKALEKVGPDVSNRWEHIAKAVGTRSKDQCKKRSKYLKSPGSK